MRDKFNNQQQKMIELFDGLSDNDLSYLEIEIQQIIINFKWQNYTFKFFII